jgi:hypothetical protein
MENVAIQMAKALEKLGNSVEQVALTLKAQKIQGIRNAVRILNPIVRYVQMSLLISNLGMDIIEPGSLRITLPDGSKEVAAVPQVVGDFLDAFNGGKYPDLEMPVEKGSAAIHQDF